MTEIEVYERQVERVYQRLEEQCGFDENDPQQWKEYIWEEKIIRAELWEDLTLKECEDLSFFASNLWGISYPAIIERNCLGESFACRRYIEIAKDMKKAPYILHEITHTIIMNRFSFKDAQHGPLFVRLFIDLCSTILHMNEYELIESAKREGLVVA
jgi:hypothetical protein